MENETNVVEMPGRISLPEPLVRQRVFTAGELQDVSIAIWRIVRNQAPRYEHTKDSLSINQLAAVAVAQAMIDELGEAFEIPSEQYDRLFWDFVEHLAAAKLRRRP